MKRSIVITLISLIVGSACCFAQGQTQAPQEKNSKATAAPAKQQAGQKQPAQATKTVYTCPMHSGVTSDKPGKCPQCKMNLEKKELAEVSYTCPMHPDVKQDKPGKCTKCGMNLVKQDSKKTTAPPKKE